MNKKVVILCAIVLAFLTGCQRGATSSSSSADSTEIKIIEEMQQRGTGYRNSSDFERAIATHDSCAQLALEIHDTTQLVIALNNLGTNYRRLGANKEAADYHFRALNLCDAYSDTTAFLAKKNRVRSLNGIGNVMLSLGNFDAAEKAFRSALAGEARLNSATGQAINLANIGSIKEHDGELDSARIYYNRSMEMNRQDSNAIGISLCYTYLGGLDKSAGRIADAIVNFRQAYAVGCTTGDIWHQLTPCLSLAEVYTEQNATDSASFYIKIGIEEATAIQSKEHLRDLYAIRSQLDEKLGNTTQALADLKLCTAYNDSILSEEERNSIQNARADYESSRRSVEVKAANEKAETDRVIRNAVAVTALLVVLFLIVAFWLYRRYVQMRHKTEQEREVFVRNIAHRLRTPMTVVTGDVQRLLAHIPTDDPEGIQAAETAQRQAHELQSLILQLANMTKSDMAPLLDEQGDKAATGNASNTSDTSGSSSASNTSVASPLPFGEGRGGVSRGGVALVGVSQEVASILLAEDTDDVAQMMCGLLREHGYSVTRAADGQEALDMLLHSDDSGESRWEGGLPDLLITDIAMPRMDGLELMRQVRADDTMCHLPIIVASARVEDSERMEGISAGAEVYLTKPFIPDELLLRVRTLLEQRERLRRSFAHLALDVKDTTATVVDEPLVAAVAEWQPQLSADEQAFIERLNNVIDDNLTSGALNVNFIADVLCVSAPTVNRRVKNITGMGCYEYVVNRRIEQAKQLLVHRGTLSVAEIGRMCGFEESTHFTRFFKRLTGVTPREFRKAEA